MSANANIIDLVKGNSSLVRPLFSPGLLLRDDDLRAGVDYTRELNRLLVRSLFGCGVVCGLEVHAEIRCGKLVVAVDSGVALSCIGDPIHVPEAKTVSIDPTCGIPIPDTLWVTLCRTDKCCAPRTAACACDDEDGGAVCTREQVGFEIRIVKEEPKDCICKERPLPNPNHVPPKSDCWCADPCQDCHRDHYDGRCACKCGDCECLVLAKLKRSVSQQVETESNPMPGLAVSGSTEVKWTVNHSVRRFVRPVLMRDPVVHKEQYPDDKPCEPRPAQPVEGEPQQSGTNDIAPADEAANRAAYAAGTALRKSAEVRVAAASGRMVEAEAAAKAAAEMAVEAEISARAVAESAAAAAVAARREVEKIIAEREAAEKALAEKLAAEAAAGAKRDGAKAIRKPPPAKPAKS